MHERGVPIWKGDAHAGTDYRPLAGPEFDVGGSEEIAASVARVGALRQRELWIEPRDQDLDGSRLGARAAHVAILGAVVAWRPRSRGTPTGYWLGGPSRRTGQA